MLPTLLLILMPYGPDVPPLPLLCRIGNPPPASVGYWSEFPNAIWRADDQQLVTVEPLGCSLRVTASPPPRGGVADFYAATRQPVDLRTQPYGISVRREFGGSPSFVFNTNLLTSPFAQFQIFGSDLVVAVGSDHPNIFEFDQIPYDPVAHKHWRFRADGQDLVLETAPDCGPWTERLRVEIIEEPVALLWIFLDHPNTNQASRITYGPVRSGEP